MIERMTVNPLEYWPTRTHKKLKVKKSKSKGGWSDDSTSSIPVENNAYARTVRMHEALHGLYTKRKILASDTVAQSIEDARIHTLARPQGSAERDEQAVALDDLRDLRKGCSQRIAVTYALRSGAILQKYNRTKYQPMIDAMAAHVGPKFASVLNKALALLRDGDQWELAEEMVRKAVKSDLAPKPEPTPSPEPTPDSEPVMGLEKSDTPTMDTLPSPPDDESSEDADSDMSGDPSDGPTDETSPLDVSGDESSDDGSKVSGGSGSASEAIEDEEEDFDPFAGMEPEPSFPAAEEMLKPKDIKKVVYSEPTLEDIPGAVSAEAIEMLSERMLERVEEAEDNGKLPKVNIVPIFKDDPIRAKVGSTVRHSIAGQRIDGKKLSLVVTPGEHKIFLKTQRSNGGTILIDASGSMQFTLQDLEGILLEAPVATIAFYNAKSDSYSTGNLWIFAYRGKRAPKLEGPGLPIELKEARYEYYYNSIGRWPVRENESVPAGKRWGSGNVIDFQVCQWLLAQPGPRYFVTDKEFCGPSYVSNAAAWELTFNAEKAGKLKTVWAPSRKPQDTFELLRKMLAQSKGRG